MRWSKGRCRKQSIERINTDIKEALMGRVGEEYRRLCHKMVIKDLQITCQLISVNQDSKSILMWPIWWYYSGTLWQTGETTNNSAPTENSGIQVLPNTNAGHTHTQLYPCANGWKPPQSLQSLLPWPKILTCSFLLNREVINSHKQKYTICCANVYNTINGCM
jgi:hypothetical protein